MNAQDIEKAESELITKISALLDEYNWALTPLAGMTLRDPDDDLRLAEAEADSKDLSMNAWVIAFEQVRFMGDGSSYTRRLSSPASTGAHVVGILHCALDL